MNPNLGPIVFCCISEAQKPGHIMVQTRRVSSQRQFLFLRLLRGEIRYSHKVLTKVVYYKGAGNFATCPKKEKTSTFNLCV